MQGNKYYYVLSPYDRQDELIENASKYYTDEYKMVIENPEFINSFKKAFDEHKDSFNISLMLTGATLIAMSYCNSVYVSKDWENDDICKICHALAFSHGLDIVYES